VLIRGNTLLFQEMEHLLENCVLNTRTSPTR